MAKWQFKVYQDPEYLLREQTDKNKRHINLVVLHYTAVKPSTFGVADTMRLLENIDEFHRNKNGWIGIGYHIAVSPTGHVFSLRPLRISGAHCRGHNNHSVGVVLIADEATLQAQPPAMLDALIRTFAALRKAYGLTTQQFDLHKHLNPTKCPPLPSAWVQKLVGIGYSKIGGDR